MNRDPFSSESDRDYLLNDRLERDYHREPCPRRRSPTPLVATGTLRNRFDPRSACAVDHEAAVNDNALWATFRPIGVMVGVDDEGNPEHLEMRNCPSCHTTRTRLVAA